MSSVLSDIAFLASCLLVELSVTYYLAARVDRFEEEEERCQRQRKGDDDRRSPSIVPQRFSRRRRCHQRATLLGMLDEELHFEHDVLRREKRRELRRHRPSPLQQQQQEEDEEEQPLQPLLHSRSSKGVLCDDDGVMTESDLSWSKNPAREKGSPQIVDMSSSTLLDERTRGGGSEPIRVEQGQQSLRPSPSSAAISPAAAAAAATAADEVDDGTASTITLQNNDSAVFVVFDDSAEPAAVSSSTPQTFAGACIAPVVVISPLPRDPSSHYREQEHEETDRHPSLPIQARLVAVHPHVDNSNQSAKFASLLSAAVAAAASVTTVEHQTSTSSSFAATTTTTTITTASSTITTSTSNNNNNLPNHRPHPLAEDDDVLRFRPKSVARKKQQKQEKNTPLTGSSLFDDDDDDEDGARLEEDEESLPDRGKRRDSPRTTIVTTTTTTTTTRTLVLAGSPTDRPPHGLSTSNTQRSCWTPPPCVWNWKESMPDRYRQAIAAARVMPRAVLDSSYASWFLSCRQLLPATTVMRMEKEEEDLSDFYLSSAEEDEDTASAQSPRRPRTIPVAFHDDDDDDEGSFSFSSTSSWTHPARLLRTPCLLLHRSPPTLVVFDLDQTLLIRSLSTFTPDCLRSRRARRAQFIDAPFFRAFTKLCHRKGYPMGIASFTEGLDYSRRGGYNRSCNPLANDSVSTGDADENHRTQYCESPKPASRVVLDLLDSVLPSPRVYLSSELHVVCQPQARGGGGAGLSSNRGKQDHVERLVFHLDSIAVGVKTALMRVSARCEELDSLTTHLHHQHQLDHPAVAPGGVSVSPTNQRELTTTLMRRSSSTNALTPPTSSATAQPTGAFSSWCGSSRAKGDPALFSQSDRKQGDSTVVVSGSNNNNNNNNDHYNNAAAAAGGGGEGSSVTNVSPQSSFLPPALTTVTAQRSDTSNGAASLTTSFSDPSPSSEGRSGMRRIPATPFPSHPAPSALSSSTTTTTIAAARSPVQQGGLPDSLLHSSTQFPASAALEGGGGETATTTTAVVAAAGAASPVRVGRGDPVGTVGGSSASSTVRRPNVDRSASPDMILMDMIGGGGGDATTAPRRPSISQPRVVVKSVGVVPTNGEPRGGSVIGGVAAAAAADTPLPLLSAHSGGNLRVHSCGDSGDRSSSRSSVPPTGGPLSATRTGGTPTGGSSNASLSASVPHVNRYMMSVAASSGSFHGEQLQPQQQQPPHASEASPHHQHYQQRSGAGGHESPTFGHLLYRSNSVDFNHSITSNPSSSHPVLPQHPSSLFFGPQSCTSSGTVPTCLATQANTVIPAAPDGSAFADHRTAQPSGIAHAAAASAAFHTSSAPTPPPPPPPPNHAQAEGDDADRARRQRQHRRTALEAAKPLRYGGVISDYSKLPVVLLDDSLPNCQQTAGSMVGFHCPDGLTAAWYETELELQQRLGVPMWAVLLQMRMDEEHVDPTDEERVWKENCTDDDDDDG